MTLDKVEVGQVVRLGCSSTRMTVHACDVEAGTVACRWFNDVVDLQEADFLPAELVLVKEAGA